MKRRQREDEDASDGVVMTLFAPEFLHEAQHCAHRALAQPKASHVAGATMGAILLACASLEADLAEGATTTAALPANLRRTARDGGSALDDRYAAVLNFVSPGSRCSRTDEFKDLRALVALRNAVAHRNAAFLRRGTWPVRLRPHASRFPVQPLPDQDWTSAVFTPPFARWAVQVAWNWEAWAEARWPFHDLYPPRPQRP